MFAITIKRLVGASFAALFIACNPYNPDLGDTPFKCGTDTPRCPDGYKCDVISETEQVCVPEDDNIPNRPDGGTDEPDGRPFACNDDSPIDNNNTIQTATPTPIPDLRDDYQLLGLAICPTTDIDIYSFRIDQSGKNLRADITFESSQGDLLLDVLNSNGLTIMSGTVADGDPNLRRAVVTNMAAGTYYIQVEATPGVENNYSVFILTTEP